MTTEVTNSVPIEEQAVRDISGNHAARATKEATERATEEAKRATERAAYTSMINSTTTR